MQSSRITQSAQLLYSFVLIYLLNKTAMVDARLVWIPRLSNEKDASVNVNDSPIRNSEIELLSKATQVILFFF